MFLIRPGWHRFLSWRRSRRQPDAFCGQRGKRKTVTFIRCLLQAGTVHSTSQKAVLSPEQGSAWDMPGSHFIQLPDLEVTKGAQIPPSSSLPLAGTSSGLWWTHSKAIHLIGEVRGTEEDLGFTEPPQGHTVTRHLNKIPLQGPMTSPEHHVSNMLAFGNT